MRIISVKPLKEFWDKHADAKTSIDAWIETSKKASWRNMSDVKSSYVTASVVSSDRVVFNIAHNKHRLIVRFDFKFQLAFVRFIGTHGEYDEIDAKTI